MRQQGLFDQLVFVAPISAIFVFTEKLDAIPNDFCRLDAQTISPTNKKADAPLKGWGRVIEKNRFANWSDLKALFNSVDRVGDLVVFDIGGNKYRLIAYIRFEKQIVYIKAVLTHQEYDKGALKP